MNVIVPFVRLEPEVELALDRDGIAASFVDTSGFGDYFELLRLLWEEGQTFIVLEQDKVPAPGLLQELWECPESWCTTPVPIRNLERCADYPTLSCTKFGEALIRERPYLIEQVGELDLGFGEREWSRLDMGIAGMLGTTHQPHWHEGGRVQHLHRTGEAIGNR